MSMVEAKKWRKLALIISVLGVILFSLPMIPNKVKLLAAVPIYLVFVYVYYKYICLKKAALADDQGSARQDSIDRGNSPKD